MDNFRWQLSCLDGSVCLMGLGNVDQGDDGVGVRLAEQLGWNGVPEVVVAGTEPERFLCVAARLDHLVFLDAVEFGGEPGSVVWLNAGEMEARFPQISTHQLSLGLLAKCVEANGRTRAWLLGVQPQSLKPSPCLSPAVRRTVAILAELIGDHFNAAARV
jgi:hydrogenase maturation protease